MDFKTVWKKEKALEKFEKENLDKEKLVEKILQALNTAHTEADKKLEEIEKCCREMDER